MLLSRYQSGDAEQPASADIVRTAAPSTHADGIEERKGRVGGRFVERVEVAFEQQVRCSHRLPPPADEVEHLGSGLDTDDPVEVAHHLREGRRAGHGAEQVVRVVDVGDPVASGRR